MPTIVKLIKVKCKRCGYEWNPKKEIVTICANPKCRTPYWDRERINKPRKNKKDI